MNTDMINKSKTKKETLGLRKKVLIFIDNYSKELAIGVAILGAVGIAMVVKKRYNLDPIIELALSGEQPPTITPDPIIPDCDFI